LLTRDLNRLIDAAPLYDAQRFEGVSLSAEANSLIKHSLTGVPLGQLNRLLLESAYPQNVVKSHGLLAKTKNDTRADFEDGYDFYDAFRRPFLPPSKQAPSAADPAPSHR
jgi:hypothetical protein